MSYKKSIFIGTLILTISGFLSRILGFYNRIFLSNLIGAKELGIYQLVMPVYMLCFTLVCHGFETGVSNLTSKYFAMGQTKPVRRLIRFTCTLSFLLSLILFVVLFKGAGLLSMYILKESSAAPALQITALALPFVGVKSCLHGYYIGRNHSGVPAASQLVEQIVRVLSIYMLSVSIFLYTADARIAAWGMVCGEIASTLYTICAYLYTSFFKETRKQNHSAPSQPLSSLIRQFFHFSIPLTINHFSLTMINSLENMLIPFMLIRFSGSRTQALEVYGTLTGMALPFLFFPATIVNSLSVMLLLAISSYYEQKKMVPIKKTISKSLHYCIIIGIFSTFAFFLYGNALGELIFDSTDAGNDLHLFAVLCPFMYASQTITSILNGFGDTKRTLYHNLVSMGVRILFVVTAIPSVGIEGYLFGLLAGYILQIILNLCSIWKITSFPFSANRTIVLPSLLALLGGWCSLRLCHMLESIGLHAFQRLVVSGASYLTLFSLAIFVGEGVFTSYDRTHIT